MKKITLAHFSAPWNISSEPEGSYHMCSVELSCRKWFCTHNISLRFLPQLNSHSTRLSFKFKPHSDSHTWFLHTHTHKNSFFPNVVNLSHIEPHFTLLFAISAFCIVCGEKEEWEWNKVQNPHEIFILLCIYALTSSLDWLNCSSEWVIWHVNQSSSLPHSFSNLREYFTHWLERLTAVSSEIKCKRLIFYGFHFSTRWLDIFSKFELVTHGCESKYEIYWGRLRMKINKKWSNLASK